MKAARNRHKGFCTKVGFWLLLFFCVAYAYPHIHRVGQIEKNFTIKWPCAASWAWPAGTIIQRLITFRAKTIIKSLKLRCVQHHRVFRCRAIASSINVQFQQLFHIPARIIALESPAAIHYQAQADPSAHQHQMPLYATLSPTRTALSNTYPACLAAMPNPAWFQITSAYDHNSAAISDDLTEGSMPW